MRPQGRPTTRQTTLIVVRRVPGMRIGQFCLKHGRDFIDLLNDFDHLPGDNVKICKSTQLWMKTLRRNNTPVYCLNKTHKEILLSYYKEYRKLCGSAVQKAIEVTCFPRMKFYGRYECWYIHANRNSIHPNFCHSCRERLDEHLGRYHQPIQNLPLNLLDFPQPDHRYERPMLPEENIAKAEELETPIQPFEAPVVEMKEEHKLEEMPEEKTIIVQKSRKQKLAQQTLDSFVIKKQQKTVEKNFEKASKKVETKTKPIQKKKKKER